MIGLQTKLIIIGVVALASSFSVWLVRHDAKVAKKTEDVIVQRSEKQGTQNATASKKAHDSARKPGAFERLRADTKTCVDCR